MAYTHIITDASTGQQTEVAFTEEEIAQHDAYSALLVKQARIEELKNLLKDTDYVALSDYDKEKPELLEQRKVWREEIRNLENE